MRWSILVSIGIWVAAVVAGWFWLNSYQEQPALTILASTDIAELGLPVYAQFKVTQSMYLERPIMATRLIVPMYVPAEAKPLAIKLIRDDRIVYAWRYPTEYQQHAETIEVFLPFITPVMLSDQLELVFDGSAISHAEQEQAPRIFTESFNAAYPQGNYSIGENQKEGDIGLTIYEEITNNMLLAGEFAAHPIYTSVRLLRWIPLLIILSALPWLVSRFAYMPDGPV